jgi:FkbM family methyltransferase
MITLIKNYEKYLIKPEKSDFLKNIFKIDSLNNDKNIYYIFGCGSATRELIEFILYLYKLPIKYILTNILPGDPEYFQVPLRKPNEVSYTDQVKVIVLVSEDRVKIENQLFVLGVKPENIIFPDNIKLKFYTHVRQWYLNEYELIENLNDIDTAYKLLNDDVSRDLFVHRLAILSGGLDYSNYRKFIKKFSYLKNPHPSKNSPENYFYFNNEIIKIKYENYIDVGAYNGDSISEFLGFSKMNFKFIYAFEPDQVNYSNLRKYINTLSLSSAELDRIILINKVAWSNNKYVHFVQSENFKDGALCTVSIDSSEGKLTEAMSIDSLGLNNLNGLAKFDVEGSEIEALIGFEKTLKQNKLDLIVSVYHRKNDFYKIPILINKFNSNYNFHLRLFSSSFLELVLIAIIP